MTTTRDELAALMGLNERAGAIRLGSDATAGDYAEYRAAESAFQIAAIGFLRTRGAELVELVGDAEHYRFLRDKVWHPSEPWQERLLMEPCQHLDAAIDAMRADGGGKG